MNGTGEDSYAGGVKEDTVCPGATTDSIPPNKTQQVAFHVYKEPGNASNSAGYILLAWSRVSEPSGTTLMDFEFNQDSPTGSGARGSGSPNVKRTAGDILIEYAIDQGGSRATITARKWTGSETSGHWGPTDTTAGSTATTTNDGTPSAQGALDGYTVTGTGGTFSWKVNYEGDTASGTDTAAHPDKETCVEESTLTIDNDNYSIAKRARKVPALAARASRKSGPRP